MSDQIKISATVLPREIITEGNSKFLLVEVALNPYLPGSKSLTATSKNISEEDALDYYREILHWYRYREIFERPVRFKLSVFNSNWKPQNVAFSDLEGNHQPYNTQECLEEPKLDDGGPEEYLWRSMFSKNTAVSGWGVYEVPYDITGRLSSTELTTAIIAALDECIDELLNDADDNNDVWLAHYLTDLKKRADLITEVFNDPVLSNSFDRRLQKYYTTIDAIIQRYNAELNDMYFDMSIREQQTRNVENTSEFHKKFSAYSNHAYLMRRTGWMWQYKINLTGTDAANIIANAANRLFVSIDDFDQNNYRYPLWRIVEDNHRNTRPQPLEEPLYLSFLREVKFVYPLTAVKFYHEQNALQKVFVASKMNRPDEKKNVFVDIHPKFGLIKVKNSAVGLKASILDRKQLMDRLDVQYQSINAARSAVDPGEMDTQNREVSNAINEEKINAAKELKSGGGVEYSNNGITLALSELDKVINTSVTSTPATSAREVVEKDPTTAIEGSSIIYLHNIVAGYRVDVYAYNALAGGNNPAEFSVGSLCEKEEHFYVKDKKRSFCLKFPQQDPGKPYISYEGWVGASAQGANSNKIYIDEELGRWNNWSLSCMRMGDNRPYVNRPDSPTLLTIAVLPPDATMVPQRFGWTYMFALRPADICGGGPLPFDQQLPIAAVEDAEVRQKLTGAEGAFSFADNYWSQPITYQRVDAIPGPVIIAGVQLFKQPPRKPVKGKEQQVEHAENRWGEDLMTLAIRSFFANNQLEYYEDHPSAKTVRYIGPPNAGVDMVLQHGALDNRMLTSRRLSQTDEELEKLRQELFGLGERLDRDISYYITGNDRIDYLYDPLADGLEIEIDNLFYTKQLGWGMFGEGQPDTAYNYIKQTYWREDGLTAKKQNQKLYRLTIKNKPASGSRVFAYNAADGDIELQQGCELTVNLNCLAQAEPKNSVALFYPGVAKARTTSLKIVHAVQKPCLIHTDYIGSGGKFLTYIGRSTIETRRFPGHTEISLDYRFEKFPVLTSESYFLHIQYIDVIGDRTTPNGYRLEVTQKVIKSGITPENPNLETDVVFLNIEHPFSSTICRAVNYQVEATSKFRKFFDPSWDRKDDFSVYGILRKRFADTTKITNDTTVAAYRKFIADSKWFYVQSTRCPEKPVVEKIVPKMTWETKGSMNMLPLTVLRRCNIVRIYFDGDWYSSGADEKLAVFFLPDNRRFSSNNVIELPVDEQPLSFQGVLTQFGLDPASGDFQPVNVIDKRFFAGRASEDFIDGIPLQDLQFAKSLGDEDPTSGGIKVSAATYDISFLSANQINNELTLQYGPGNFEKVENGKYFVDITVDESFLNTHYFPFLRLAIARYQPHAQPTLTPGKETLYYHFSQVAITDFVQMLPSREIVVQPNKAIDFRAAQRRKVPEQPSTEVTEDARFKSNSVLMAIGISDTSVTAGPELADLSEALNLNVVATEEKVATIMIQSDVTTLNLNTTGLKLLHLMEYENYNDEDPGLIPQLTESKTDLWSDLRNDHTKRLVFSYTLKF